LIYIDYIKGKKIKKVYTSEWEVPLFFFYYTDFI
jgi:hypothetical protein